MPVNFSKMEEEILDFWEKNKIFQKSVQNRPESKPYVFYDGPPFATGLPHYGHIVASLMKDVVPRYWTMRGFRVERIWGWDCHGLPIENIIEEKLKLKSKKDIEDFGIDKFNEECRNAVLTYAEEWKKTIKRMGRWVDMENAYKTMDLSYMESVWWVFRQLWDKRLIYQGHKSMHICPRCVTPLSNFEVTQNYKEVEDLSVIVKFQITNYPPTGDLPKGDNLQINSKLQVPNDKPIYLLAWTTTPWTLAGNVLLAVNKDIGYWILDIKGEEGNFVVAEGRVPIVIGDKRYEIKKKIKGADLVGLKYEPLFPYFAETPNAFRVVVGDFVSTEEGTGIVHIAPAFGEDDYNLGQREKVPLVQHVSMEGKFVPAVKDFAGWEVKPKEAPTKTDAAMVAWLEKQGKIFSQEKVVHSYPHCWRCETPLLNYATSSWFVKVADLKEHLLKNNKDINWVPAHMKEGRFGEWLKGARDWAISRSRYWGTPLPVWQCRGDNSNLSFPRKRESSQDKFSGSPIKSGMTCDNAVVVGSVKELEELNGQKINDLHKHIVDKITFKCEKCGGEMKRIPEVLDCWFDSGSMPYGQWHYPFENKKKFEASFPAEFIAEGQDQTRGWFYTMHVLATALTIGKKPSIPVKKSSSSFKNVIVNGIVLAEDGKKMSKRLKNYPEPELILEKYGADAMRYYLLTSPVMEAENLNFSEAGVREMYNKVVNTLWNVVEFYRLYVGCHSRESGNPVVDGLDPRSPIVVEDKLRGDDRGRGFSRNILDRWILAKLNLLIKDVTKGMEEYKLVEASRPIMDFIADLSQWWLRRSRARFKSDNPEEKNQALNTLYFILNTLSKIMAPFTPFIAEKVYQLISKSVNQSEFKESVHLEEWPKTKGKLIDKKVLDEMKTLREVVSLCLGIRAKAGIPVRQALCKLIVNNRQLDKKEYLELLKEELNVEEVVLDEQQIDAVSLDTTITPELKEKGLVRELVRQINQLRKEAKLTIKDKIDVYLDFPNKKLAEIFEKYKSEIKTGTLAENLVFERKKSEFEKVVEIGEEKINLGLERK